jgi:ATP-binding cassette subfamily F protein 3
MMISGPNTLLLDEPTNHIDIQTKDVMTQALKDYEGSIVCISHDRYFIEELATDIWEIYNGHLLTYCGGYEYYLAKREETRNRIDSRKKPEPEPETKAPSVHQQSFRERKELEKQFKKIEKTILTLEKDIQKLEKDLHNPEYQEDYQKLQDISASISKKTTELEKLNAEWLILSESIGETSNT